MGKSTNSEELNSLITSASIDKLRLKEPLDESSTPVKSSGEWVTGAGFLVGTPNRYDITYAYELETIGLLWFSRIMLRFCFQ